ncbi:hypothetical protein AC18_1183 [Escherichia coli 2-222-05_S3_C2]|nr:hypothetical protein AC46_3909 [Escherichia coli 2-222-05_S3_C3]KEN91876.1 hypothetical protein AB88_0906 [Escherichia coli 2-222-05_S3_C1]KEO00867.1 hypothetical protein AC18_1183 [Escherichia coli 2-222-05_S3_C2]CCP98236.1 hypothetical protein ECK5_45320 [Escherichia coli O10:K5(L):H4 str. ATCC 23506]
MQKICKIGSNWKSFNTRTIGSSPAIRSNLSWQDTAAFYV